MSTNIYYTIVAILVAIFVTTAWLGGYILADRNTQRDLECHIAAIHVISERFNITDIDDLRRLCRGMAS